MLERSRMGKDSNNYDPQVGAAALANTALAQRAQQFSEDYFNQHITPLLDQQSALAKTADEREGKMFDLNYDQMQTANDRYKQYGIPAEDAYYQMVKDYSAPDEQEREAASAIGDQRVAAQGQANTVRRQMASMGIDPSSPAAMAAMSDAAVQNSALEAAAANRARSAAKTLGMQLTSDAANFGRGQTSQTLAFGQAANSNISTGAGVVGNALQTTTAAAQPVQTGYGLGISANSQNLNAYTKLQQSAMEQQGQAASGLGNFLGAVAGAAIKSSDRRLKTNIVKIARMPNGIGVYQFNYRWEPKGAPTHIGYMADEVEKVFPDAVALDPSGFKTVDYSKVVI